MLIELKKSAVPSRTVQVVLIRAGSTEYEDQGRIQGTLDVPLSPGGRAAVVHLASELQREAVCLDRLYCGTGQSCRQTAELIAPAVGATIQRLVLLHNLDQGLWQGLQEQEVRRRNPRVYRQWLEAPLTVCPPGGELVAEALDRVARALRVILKKARSQRAGIVVPEPLAGLVDGLLSEQPVAAVWHPSPARPAGPAWKSIPLGADGGPWARDRRT